MKRIIALMLCAMLLVATTPTVQHAQAPAQEAKVVIKAADRVKIGDLITIDLSESRGSGFDYIVMPKPPEIQIYNDGKTIVCGTGAKNQTYLFTISCALGDDSDIEIHAVTVYGPDDPVPDAGENMVEKVKEWCDDVESPSKRDDALKLAQSFSSVAVIIDQDSFSSAAELVKATATSNRDALSDNLENWSPLLDSLMSELKAMDQAGKLPDVRSHAVVWKEVAQGLREYAASLE